VRRFHAFGEDLANRLVDGVLHRAVGGCDVSIRPVEGGVDVEPLDDESRAVVLHLLGASYDLPEFYAWASGPMAEVTERLHGFRPPSNPDPFEALITSVTAQQVSLFAAVAIRNRFVQRFGEQVGEAWAFPTRERIAAATEEDLVGVGFTRRKAEYAVALARSDEDLHALALLPDDEVRLRIVSFRGLGPWTAEWFLARHLARPHAWPAGDLVLRKRALDLYGVGVDELAQIVHPFENLSAQYLLAS
jgi:DNA-3-methyladenine glycosylase II